MTAATDGRPERIAAELERRYPGTSVWWGRSTRNWWALARDRMGRHRLVEAASPSALGRRLDELDVRPPVPRYTRDRIAPARPALEPAPTRPAEPRHRRSGRRGWLRSVFGGLVAT